MRRLLGTLFVLVAGCATSPPPVPSVAPPLPVSSTLTCTMLEPMRSASQHAHADRTGSPDAAWIAAVRARNSDHLERLWVEWEKARAQTCAASRRGSIHELREPIHPEQRALCLRAVAFRLEAVAEVLGEPTLRHPELVDDAVSALDTAIQDCATAPFARPYDEQPTNRDATEARRRTARAWTQRQLLGTSAKSEASAAIELARRTTAAAPLVEALLEASWIELPESPEGALRLATEAFERAVRHQDTLGRIEADLVLGLARCPAANCLKEGVSIEPVLSDLIRLLGRDHPRVARARTLVVLSARRSNGMIPFSELDTALTAAVDRWGERHLFVAAARVLLGDDHASDGSWCEAIHEHQLALDARLQLLGPAHPLIAESYAHLGDALTGSGERSRGLEFLQQALAMDQQVSGPSGAAVARRYERLAELALESWAFQEANRHLQAALAVWRARAAEDPEHLAACYDRLATLEDARNDIPRAMELRRLGVAALVEHLGETAPATFKARDKLGAVLLKRGQAAGAIEEYQKALEARILAQAPAGEIAINHDLLGGAYAEQGDHRRALEAYEAAIRLRKDQDGYCNHDYGGTDYRFTRLCTAGYRPACSKKCKNP